MNLEALYGRRAMWILMLFLFFLPLTFRGARKALDSNRNDVKEWLPDEYQETQDFEWFRRHFAGEQFVLVSWEGCTLEDQRLRLLAAHLRPPAAVASRSADDKPLFSEVVTGPELLEKLTSAPTNLTIPQAMRRLEGLLVGKDQRTTCAVVTLSQHGAEHLRKSVEAIRLAARQICNIPRDQLRLGGPPVDNVALDEEGESSLHRIAVYSVIVGLIISWWCLRSPKLVIMVFVTGMYGGMLALAMVWYSGGAMNAILLTMPSLVYVAATSGAIHLSNYYREAVEEGGVKGAAGRAVRHAMLPLALATGTTSAGLLSLLYSELVPIQMFGVYSAAGVVGTLVPLWLVLPAMLETWPIRHRPHADPGRAPRWTNPIERVPWSIVGRRIVVHGGLLCALLFGMMAAVGWGIPRAETSINLMRFFDPKSEIRQNYAWLEENLGPLVPMEVILRFDDADCRLNMLERLELVARVHREIETIPEVGSCMSAATFAPQLPGGQGRSIQRIAANTLLRKHRDKLIDGDYLSPADDEELWRISARVQALNNMDYGAFQEDLMAKVEPILAAANVRLEQRRQAELGSQASAAADVAIAAGEGEQPPPGRKAAIAATYTGLVPLVYKAQRSLMDGLIWGFFGDWLLVAVVMMIVVWDWSAGLLLMIPSVFPAVIVFGVMGWTGVLVDTGTVMAPAVALGVTVDDVVHFMLKYRDALRQGASRHDAIMAGYQHCGQAIYQSWGVIGLGLSVFALSHFMPTQRFGVMMVTLLTASTFGNLVLLPAVLASPLGHIFTWRVERKRDRRARETAAAGPPPPWHVPAAARLAADGQATAQPDSDALGGSHFALAERRRRADEIALRRDRPHRRR